MSLRFPHYPILNHCFMAASIVKRGSEINHSLSSGFFIPKNQSQLIENQRKLLVLLSKYHNDYYD